MMMELLSIFGVFDWIYGDPDRYVTESIFALIFSGFVVSMYVIMKINKRKKENKGQQ